MSNVKVSVSTGAPVPTSTPDAVDHIVAQWQREMPALASENMILFGRLKRCTALLQARLEAVFAEHGLNTASFDVLATLRRAGKPYSLTPTALFESLMVTSGTMTNRLQRLEEKGLIRRLPNPEDARSQLVQLTPQGKALIEQAAGGWVEDADEGVGRAPSTRMSRYCGPTHVGWKKDWKELVYLAADGPSGHEGVKVHASCPKRGSLSIQERFHGIPDGRKVLDENRMFGVRMTERLPSDNMR